METTSTHLKQPERKTSPFLHLVWFAIGYGLIVFFCTATMFAASSFPTVPFMTVFSIGIATVVLSAAWAVFGPGGYLKRAAIALGLALIVGLGLVASLAMGAGQFAFLDPAEVFRTLGVIACGIPLIAMAAQLPFLFLRMFFGWQFVLGDSKPAKPFSLRDIFTVTFLFALSFASPQVAMNLSLFGQWNDPVSDVQPVSQPAGSESYEQATLPDLKEMEDRRRIFVQEERLSMAIVFATAAFYVFVLSTLCLPIVLFVFRSKHWARGLLFTFLYSLAWFLFYIGLLGLIAPAGVAVEMAGSVAFLFLSTGAAISIPLTVSRSQRFSLTSPRRYQRKQLAEGRVGADHSGSDAQSPVGDAGPGKNTGFGGVDDSKPDAPQQMGLAPKNEPNEE